MQNQQKLILVLVVLVIFLMIVSGAWIIWGMDRETESDSPNQSQQSNDEDPNESPTNRDVFELGGFSITDNNFTAEGNFDSETGTWNYSVNGYLPTPCHRADVNVEVAESAPELVSINLVVSEPAPDLICSQVVSEYDYSGEFTASENAQVNFNAE